MNIDDEVNRPGIQTGRVDTGLGPLQIQIVDAAGTHLFDPNTLKLAVLAIERPDLFRTEKVRVVAPGAKFSTTADSLIQIEPLNLSKPVGPSNVSGEPGYLYRTHDVQILLTKDEMCRLALRRLHPAEVLQLLSQFGEFFEIHEDFYDPESGEAWQ